MDMTSNFFNPGPFMPHGGCYLWTQSLIALHTLSDAAIVLAYYSIPFTLLYFVRKRKDLKFHWIFVCFAVFVLACGTTHLMEIWNIWHADYWLSGCIKAITALTSVPTAFLLIKLVPQALALPSAEALRKAHAELEIRVRERTAELEKTTQNLRAEITERQQAEVVRQRSEQNYREIFNATNEAIFLHETNTGGILDVNDAMLRLYGYGSKAEALTGNLQSLSANDPPYTQADAQRHIRRALEAGPQVFEWLARKKNGDRFWAEVSLRSSQIGGEGRILAVVRDATERKRADQLLIESEQRYHDLFAHMNEGFACCQMFFEDGQPKDFVYLAVNEMFTTLTGLKDVAGKRVTKVIPGIRESDPELFEIYGRVAATGKPEKHERFLAALQMWFELSVYSTGQDLFVVVFDVITGRKQAEEALARNRAYLQTIVANEPECVKLLDRIGCLLDMNPAGLAMIEADSLEQVRGHCVHPIVKAGPDRAAFEEMVAAVFRGETRQLTFEIIGLKGTARWLESHSVPLWDAPHEKIESLLAVTRDITQRKQAEEQTRTFARLSERLSVSIDPRAAAGAVTDTALELFNWDACFLLLYDDATDIVRELINQDTINDQRVTVPIAAGVLHPTPTLRRVIEHGGQLELRRDATDDKTDTRRFGDLNRPSLSLLYVPLRHLGQVTGFLSVQSYRRDAYTARDLVTLQALADQCAGAIARIDAEAALRAALTEAQRFRAAMDEVHACVYMKDVQSRYIYANRPTVDLFGCGAGALMGRDDTEFFPPDTVRRLREIDARVFAGEQTVEEIDIPNATGGRRVYWEVKTPIYADAERKTVCGLLGISTDITERKLMEEVLQHSRSLLAESEKMGKVGSWEFDIATRQQLWTETVYDIHEVDHACQPTVEQGINFYTPASRPIIKRAVQRAIELGETFDVELQIITAKGNLRHVHAIGHADLVRGKVFGFFQDITQQKRAEQALHESQALYHSLVTQMPIGLFRKDIEGRYVLVNPGFCRLKGVKAEEFLGKTPLQVNGGETAAPDVTGLATKYAAEGEDHHRLIMETGKAVELDEEYLLAGGKKHFVHVMKLPVFNPDGKVIGTQGVMFDITALKQAEEQVNLQFSALTAAANAIVITDRHGKIEWVNPSFTKLTGYRAAEAIGGNPRVLKSGQHPPAFYAKLWATITTGNVWHGELVNKRKDGRLYTEDMTITPVRGADGQIAHFVAIKQDATERRLLENRLQQAQKMEAIGTLAGGIAHDFNNILAAIFGYGNLLQQDTEGNSAAQEDIGEILKAATRAKDLVQQILTFSRQRERKREVIHLDIVVKEAMKFLRASLPAQIKIEMQLANDAPAVLADPTQIYQVTMNLATNGLHAMGGQAGTLTVSLESFQPDEQSIQARSEFQPIQYARLVIADTGCGMEAKTLEHIFEPFFTTKPVGKGTGLGLAVMHGIVQSHEGIVTVESEVGRGTTFSLYFPAQTGHATLTETTMAKLGQGRSQNILLLDDEPALTASFRKLLERLNYQVTTSNSAREAVALFRENPAQFDLVITDLTMPEMNGLEVARQLRSLRPDVPIIMASGLTPELTPENLHDAGICELLEKPVSLTVLDEVLQRTLARR